MKFILNKDKLKIEGALTINSGSFRDYLIDVETDESWDGLSIEAIIAIEKSNEGISRAVINNQVYIDVSKKERYTIGFIGYTIENNVKTYQRSTDLKLIPIVKGAGEIETTNAEEIPTTAEWEVYLAQVQEFINNGNAIINQANNLDVDLSKEDRIATITITKKDGTEKSVQISDGEKGDKGDDYVITQEDYQEIADIVENQINIPAKTSDLTNDSGFITKLVNDLSNYYLKSETYTKTEVNNLIGQIGSIQFQVVNELPVTGNSSYIYLVPSSNPTTQNIKDEYIWVNNAWEQIGSTDVELSNYQTKIDSSHKLNSDLVDDTNQTNKFVTSTEKTTWNNKSNFSGSYNDLTDKPTIPNEVTESTVSGWGFTKNVGTITEITMNGSSKGTGGVVDLGTVITSHQDISSKENVSNKSNSYTTSSTTTYASTKALVDGLATKQDTLTPGTNISIQNNVISGNYSEASASASGLMSINDKSKLDSMTPALYALKSELSGLTKFKIEVIPSGSTHSSVVSPDGETIYLERGTGNSPDMYSEYIYIPGTGGSSGTWELLGQQRVDLTGYLQKEILFDSGNGTSVSDDSTTYIDFDTGKSLSGYTDGYVEIFFRQNTSVDGNSTPTGGLNSVKTLVHSVSGAVTMEPVQLISWIYDSSNTVLKLTACVASLSNGNRLTFSNAENSTFNFTIYRVVGYK